MRAIKRPIDTAKTTISHINQRIITKIARINLMINIIVNFKILNKANPMCIRIPKQLYSLFKQLNFMPQIEKRCR